MGGLPDALFVIDVDQERIAVTEANNLKIPVFGIVDTNSSPDGVDFVIPGNDDAIRAIQLYVTAVSDACMEGRGSGEVGSEFVEVEEVALNTSDAVEVEDKAEDKKGASDALGSEKVKDEEIRSDESSTKDQDIEPASKDTEAHLESESGLTEEVLSPDNDTTSENKDGEKAASDKDEEEFIVDIHNAVFMTKGMRNDYKDKVYEQKGLVNYLTKQSNRTIDNIDIRNSRY